MFLIKVNLYEAFFFKFLTERYTFKVDIIMQYLLPNSTVITQ